MASEPLFQSGCKWPTLNIGPAHTGRPPLQCAMLLFPGFTMLDLIGPQTVLCGPVTTQLVAKTRDPVISDTGISISPAAAFDDIPQDLDILFVPGGPGQVDVFKDDATLAFLADRGARARWVTAVCTGSLILGAAGLLKGYKATTHWAAVPLLPIFGAEHAEGRVIIDRNRITGGGVTAGIDFGLTLLDAIFGPGIARATQLLMEYDPAPPFDAGNPNRAGDGAVKTAFEVLSSVAEQTMKVLERRNLLHAD